MTKQKIAAFVKQFMLPFGELLYRALRVKMLNARLNNSYDIKDIKYYA